MGSLADKLKQAGRIGLDTSPFIFYLEENTSYLSLCDEIFDTLENGDIEAVTSTVSLLEVLVRPISLGKTDMISDYRDLLTATPKLTLRSLDAALAEKAAELRAKYRIRTPDAVQLAACTEFEARCFLTNDDRLRRVDEDDLEIIVLRRWLEKQPGK